MTNYKVCSKTIMDTTDPNIVFNENDESDYYINFQKNIVPEWNFGKDKLDELLKFAEKVKQECKNKEFDCIIGLSGGLDSSYCVYVTKKIMGLRPLIYHVDAGWNTEQATSNIEKLITGLDLDLYTDVINWKEMKDLQRSFFKSQIPDQDMPQDIAFFSSLYKFAKKNNIKYVFTGANYSTECCRETEEWGAYPGIDVTLINDIFKKFGTGKLKTFPIVDIFKYKIYYQRILGMKVFHPLNYVEYNKKDVEKLLNEKFGWESFKHKHHESRFTRFIEDYWLPRKFGFDKRKAHLSSLILTGQMTREEALERISKPELDEQTLMNEKNYILSKLGFSQEEFEAIFKGENKTYKNYKSKRKLIGFGIQFMRTFGLEKRLFR
ncbi:MULTISPECIES: N-acetyl sugar amidotransferase [Empedobacter]|uniref:N-acetyl sugar amidotransferase n=1 Tax=Empedobacter TaxID=59734 RepID=UPI002574A990|nr:MULTISPECIES: N-acetyl sugar amidotransferase [Empedobacter]MDM1042803.1 N-acetyl sugar amidotransferase [Empedobacter brevis]MDM1136733.1 N-acetyl sugar amidotransferase [Empedobacter sp. R750]